MGNADDWIWLHIACPVDGCTNNIETYWSHRNCPNSDKDHDIKINSDGYLKCNACNTKAPLIEWRFDCGCGHGLKEASNIIRLTEILQIMSKSSKDQKFVVRLMKSIGKMFSKD